MMRGLQRHTALAWGRVAMLVVALTAAVVFGATATAGAATTHYTYTASQVVTYAASPADTLSAPTVTIADTLNNRLYVLDSGKNRIVWYNLDTRTYAGTYKPSELDAFNNPRGMALQPGVGSAARLFVSDTGNNRLVVLQPNGSTFDVKFRLTTSISNPRQMVWSVAADRLYVLNRLSGGTASEVRIYRSNTNAGTPEKNQLMYVSSFTGTAAGGLSANANGINVLSDNSLAVADTGNNRIVRFGIDGTYVNQFGSFSATNAPRDKYLTGPMGVVSRPDGYVPVLDTGNHRLQVFLNSSGGEVVAEFGEVDQAGTALSMTRLNSPEYGLYLSSTLSVVSDTGSNRLVFVTVSADPQAPPRVPTNFDGVGCTDCHGVDTRIEHEYRTRRRCLTCHEYSFRTHQIDFTLLKPKIVSDMTEAGVTDMGTCGANTIVCHAAGAKSDAGENIATHGMDGAQIQGAHRPQKADGTLLADNPCSGSGTGCHSYGSTESKFWFAAQDPASAKLDYWKHLTSNTASMTAFVTGSTDMTGTVDIRNIDPPCLVCHDKRVTPTDKSFGETQKATALANGQDWTCTTAKCHDPSGASGVYAQSQCYRTPKWWENHKRVAGDGIMSGASVMSAESADTPVGVSAYFESLVSMVFGAPESQEPEVTALSEPQNLPGTSTPASAPTSLDMLLSPHF